MKLATCNWVLWSMWYDIALQARTQISTFHPSFANGEWIRRSWATNNHAEAFGLLIVKDFQWIAVKSCSGVGVEYVKCWKFKSNDLPGGASPLGILGFRFCQILSASLDLQLDLFVISRSDVLECVYTYIAPSYRSSHSICKANFTWRCWIFSLKLIK
jgi:hypothetical protein